MTVEHRWIDEFRKEHGRAPRVLHIGNIANNAYLNSKFLNEAGLECDVLCYDYYHIMGCPEWEDADFTGAIEDHFMPNWSSVDLKGFERPAWFAQGPLNICAMYLTAKSRGSASMMRLWRTCMERFPRTRIALKRLALRDFRSRSLGGKVMSLATRAARNPLRWWSPLIGALGIFALMAMGLIVTFIACMSLLLLPFYSVAWAVRWMVGCMTLGDHGGVSPLRQRSEVLSRQFSANFPARTPRMSSDDVRAYASTYMGWSALLQYYDLIQAYSTDPILPMLCGVKPFVAFEHGTIRSIPFEDTSTGRLTALAYRLANGVIITNCDNKEAAGRLGLENYRFIPHPVNDLTIAAVKGHEELRKELEQQLDADFLAFHPSRQHWEERRHPDWEKGNDIFIRGFARFVKDVNPRAGAVFVRWGQKVAQTEELLRKLGIDDRVLWVPPQPNVRMVRYVKACDLVADQFYLGAFGSTLPKALACGRACMIYLNEEVHRWCFPELPPVLNTRTPEEIFDELKRFTSDPDYRESLEERGLEWYRKYHSSEVVVRKHLEMYGEILAGADEKTS